MKTESEIQDRLRTIFAEELDSRVRMSRKRLPKLCAHCYQHPLDTRPTVHGEANERLNNIYANAPTMGLCLYGASDPVSWSGTICEDPIDAQRCATFTPISTVAQIWFGFNEQVNDQNWLKANLPEAYGLLWVLGTAEVLCLPWWRRWWWRLLRINPRRQFGLEPLKTKISELFPELPSND